MPSESAAERPGQRVEGADEDGVEYRTLPAPVEARLDGESLFDDAHLAKGLEQCTKLLCAVLEKDRRVVVLERHLHQLRERVQPGDAVVDLEDRFPSGFQHAPALADQGLRLCGVLDDTVRVDQVERLAGKWQVFAIRLAEIRLQALMLKVAARQRDGRRREI